MTTKASLLAGIPEALPEELVDVLAASGRVRIERIVSRGHASPPGFWYDQDDSELVVLVQGRAALEIAGRADPVVLEPGDYLSLPAHLEHRVAWTEPDADTVWLAVFY